METIASFLVLLLAVVAGNALSRASPLPLPAPLVQIALGVTLGLIAKLRIELQPDVFFLLFLPPLLFLDGWRIPKERLLHDLDTILGLALGLVVFTVAGAGLFIAWLIPAMPLAVAFALAAVVSPTDPVAVSAIAERSPIPKRLMHILEGEALLNDASGLVCMRFAVMAALTGAFSLLDAAETFLWLALGGVAVGAAVTWSVIRAKRWIAFRLGEEPGQEILISLLIPCGAYLLAEHLGCSGILAAVAAGITMSHADKSGAALPVTRVRRTVVWDAVQFTTNGMVFVLLGEQLPQIAAGAARAVRHTHHHEVAWLLVYVLATTAALGALRLLWVWASLRFLLLRAAWRRQPMHSPGWRLLAVTALAGVRGAVTLAGVFTLPVALRDGTPFPARDLAVLLAAGVIVVSLIVASIGLPLLAKGLELPAEPSEQEAEDWARVAAAEAAIKAIERAVHALAEARADAEACAAVGSHVIEFYRHRVDTRSRALSEAASLRQIEGIERELRLTGVRAERDAVYSLGRIRRLSDATVRKLVHELDFLEAHLTAG